jgi:oligopeptidase B
MDFVEDVESHTVLEPVIVEKPDIIPFGKVDGVFTGNDEDKMFNPPYTMMDEYNWLRDESRKNEEVLSVVNAENHYIDLFITENKDFIMDTKQELRTRVCETYDTHKFYAHNYVTKYKQFKSFEEGLGYPIVKRINTATGEVQILLDANQIHRSKYTNSETGEVDVKGYCDVEALATNEKGTVMVYGYDYDGDEKYDIVLVNLETNEQILHYIPQIPYGNISWVSNTALLFVLEDENHRPYKIEHYNIETGVTTSLFHEQDKEYNVGFGITSDSKFIIITSCNNDYERMYVIDVNDDKLFVHLMCKAEYKVHYGIEHHNGEFIVHTNHNDKTWKITSVPVMNVLIGGGVDNNTLKTVIPANPTLVIKSFIVTADYLVFMSNLNGTMYTCYFSWVNPNDIFMVDVSTGETVHTINRAEWASKDFSYTWSSVATDVDLKCYTFDSNVITFQVTSSIEPTFCVEFDIDRCHCETVYTATVPNYDPSLYTARREYVDILDSDGVTNVRIPITVMFKTSLFKTGKNPLYLYGYGSYGLTITDRFSSTISTLLDRGFVHVCAHVRGSGFLGWEWYQSGKMEKKINTFTDFIACAEYCINNGLCDKNEITCEGRSAGGLLMGAITVMRPSLFKNIIMGVPFVDMMATMRDSTIPLTTEEWDQWGNPNYKTDFEHMIKICPYTNIKAGQYPNIYVTVGLNDPRVQYWEGLKFIARVRRLHSGEQRRHMIKINMGQGHFGGSDRYHYLEEIAEKYAFIMR